MSSLLESQQDQTVKQTIEFLNCSFLQLNLSIFPRQLNFEHIEKLVVNIENSVHETQEDDTSVKDDKFFLFLSIGLGALSGVLLILLVALYLFFLRCEDCSQSEHDQINSFNLAKRGAASTATNKCPEQSPGDMNPIFTSDLLTRWPTLLSRPSVPTPSHQSGETKVLALTSRPCHQVLSGRGPQLLSSHEEEARDASSAGGRHCQVNSLSHAGPHQEGEHQEGGGDPSRGPQGEGGDV